MRKIKQLQTELKDKFGSHFKITCNGSFIYMNLIGFNIISLAVFVGINDLIKQYGYNGYFDAGKLRIVIFK